MDEALQRLKILLNSNASIVVIETVEEMRAVNLVREACSELRLAVFEWTIADGLVRSGSKVPVDAATAARENDFVVGDWAAFRHHRGTGVSGNTDLGGAAAAAAAPEMAPPGMYNTRDPNQALANMAAMTVDGVFIMKDLHRHMDDPAIVRRLRDVAQRFSINRRTVVITAPEITMPRELASLVEYLDIPLPGSHRLREIIDETFNRMSRSLTIKRRLDDAGLNAMAENLRGLTEGEAERALSQAVVSRYELSDETVTEVL